MPYRDRRERRHERRENDSREKTEDRSKKDDGKKDTRSTRKDSDRSRTVKHSKTSRNRSRSRDNDSEQDDSRTERTDRFKSERFADDTTAYLTSLRRNDRDFRSNKIGRSAVVRDGRRPSGGYQERRYDRRSEDHDMSRVTEKLVNPTYVPKDNRYFLHDDREMSANTRRRFMQRSRSPLKWEHDKFKDHELKEQEEIAAFEEEDDSDVKWRSVVQVPMGSTGFGPQYDNFYHQHQRQQDGRWMHDKYFEMERAATAAETTVQHN